MTPPLCKLPCPTRSLPACAGRSLLEGWAFDRTAIVPRSPCVAGARLPFAVHGPGDGSESYRDPRHRTRSVDCSAGLIPGGANRPSTGHENHRSRPTGASLLVAPADPDVCEDDSRQQVGYGTAKLSARARLMSALLSGVDELLSVLCQMALARSRLKNITLKEHDSGCATGPTRWRRRGVLSLSIL